jgi:hypothetical protein
MAYHVYDGTYQGIMTIACCNFQSKYVDGQVFYWQNLNYVMTRHGISKPHFKGFMTVSAQANWNVVRIAMGPKIQRLQSMGVREPTTFIGLSFWIKTPDSISNTTCNMFFMLNALRYLAIKA